MPSNLTESVDDANGLEWFGELVYALGQGPHLAPYEPGAEWHSFGEVVLVGRRRETIRQLNPASSIAPQTTVAKSATVQSRSWLNL